MLTDPMDHSGEYRPRAKINEIARKPYLPASIQKRIERDLQTIAKLTKGKQ